ncbi:Remorin [Heracleum sosnowskyi]|uniref:Remorin n=1 Tax=Heracleum sosnowskyi TaxID=360622 RepID=A0AAD8MBN1_9APIA|nr:Remorin [Heracleum sosnowskyi]
MSLGNHLLATTITTTTNQENLDDHGNNQEHNPRFRDIHALAPPHPPRLRQPWETSSRTPSQSTGSFDAGSTETNVYSAMSREFNALVLGGSTTGNNGSEADHNSIFMGMIGEEEEMNPLAIVPDTSNHVDPQSSPCRPAARGSSTVSQMNGVVSEDHVSVHGVKKGEVEMKILAWQNAKIAKITNRFKREDAIIKGWEGEQIQKSSSKMKKVERKLEEKRARAQEKMENEIAKAHRKAEERKASAEARRGTKVAKVFEIAHLMKAIGKAPPKRSF